MDEANTLQKQLMDANMSLRTLKAKRPGRQGTIPTIESGSIERKDKGTQTMRSGV